MEDLEIKNLSVYLDENLIVINIGGVGGESEFLTFDEADKLADFIKTAINNA